LSSFYRLLVVRVDCCAAPWPLSSQRRQRFSAGHCWATRCDGGPAVFFSWPLAFCLHRYPPSGAEHHVLVLLGPDVQQILYRWYGSAALSLSTPKRRRTVHYTCTNYW